MKTRGLLVLAMTLPVLKPTDVGACMNAKGDTPAQYKTSVIKGFLYRARSLCSDHGDMMLEIKRCKQILVNNGYSNIEVEKEIKSFLRRMDSPPSESQSEGSIHTLFYRNFMNNKCKEDERVLKRIVKENVSLKDNRDRLKLVIYYKNMKSRNLIMRNNCAKKPREFAKTHVVYKFRCKKVTVSTFLLVKQHTPVLRRTHSLAVCLFISKTEQLGSTVKPSTAQ